jgi:mRNA interferase MazF
LLTDYKHILANIVFAVKLSIVLALEETGIMNIKRGDIYMVDMGTQNKQGSEQTGIRPCCIIQNNLGNKKSPTTVVALLTSKDKRTSENKPYPMHVHLTPDDIIGELDGDSIILCEQVYTIDKSRLRRKKGYIDPASSKMNDLDDAIKVSLGL